MADPFNPQPQRNTLDDILDQAFNDLELERQRQESIINAPDPAQRLGEIQKVEKQVENEVPEVQEAVRQKAYTDTSYYTGRPFASQQPQKQGKKRQPISEAMYNRLAQGSAELGQGLASAPGLIYGLASFPQRQLAKIPGLESLDDGTREVEEYLSLNPVAKYYKDTADKFRDQNTRYDESIVDYIKQGNLVDALGLTAVEIVGSIPYTASMIAGGYAGVPAKLTVPAVGAVTGGQKNSTLLEEMPELADDKRTLNALVDGLAEGTFEQLGSAGIGRTIKSLSGDLIKQFGRENGDKILKESIAKVFSDKSSRFMVPKAMNQEGWEEFATTVMQNWNAQKTGEDPGRDLFEGAIDSYIVGAGAGGAITAPVGIAVRKQRKEAKKLEKAKKKGMEAIESGQLRQLTNDDISEFARSLSKEEAMKLGVIPDYENQSISYDPKTELGKEMIRRNLEMDKFPETETELREAGARATIKQQQMEGKDFVGKLIKKAQSESGIAIEREYMDRTLADEIEQEGWTEEETKKVLQDHGIDEEADPKDIIITGTSFGGSVRISTAGTETRMADEYVAVQEEMAEEYYKAEQENNPEFENEITEDRRKYHESTGEKDTGESNLEWFSSKAIQFNTQGKVHQSIGAKLTEIFNRFIDNARTILKDAFKLRKAIREGKVSDSLLKKLEEATDFKKVGEKVQQAKESKKQPTYRTVKAEKPAFEKGSTENKLIGYRVMRYDPNTGKAISGADGRQSILPKKGEDISYGGGFYLTNDPQYATDYYAVHDNNILIKVEFDKNDLLKGSLTDREPEISVKKGKILDTQIITEEVESTSYRLTTQESYELHDTAKRIFGTTENPKEAGYILLDGEMLDFSGKNEGGTPGTRSYDHRQINQVGIVSDEEYYGASGEERWSDIGMEEFIESGAIRWMPEANSFNLMDSPDTPQLSRMRQLVEDANGEVIVEAQEGKKAISKFAGEGLYREYEEGTPFEEIKRDILQFYRTGKGPSITQQFHSSYRLSKKSGGDLVWKNTPIVKQPNLLELTKYLTERAKSIADELGVDLTQNTPEAIDIVSNVVAEEIKIETGNKKNALGWYSIKMQNAIELLSQIHPKIMEDPDHNQVFKVALAITSNGTPVEDNLKIAMVAYEHWKDKGVLPSTFKVGGQEGPAMASAFKVYNKHQKEIGTTAFHTFLNTEFTVKEIRNMGYKVSGELVDAKVMGAVIFGPKIGAFLSNINGHYQYLTMDRWFMRTIGRIRGDLKPQQDYSDQLKRFRTALRINPSKMKLYEVSKEDLKNDDKVIDVARKVLKEYAKSKFVKTLNRKASFYPKTKLNMASNTLIKRIDEIQDDPKNATDRKYLREIMKIAVEKSDIEGLTMADAQAIIWFPEKRFFSKFGVGSQRGKKETDYETEARQYVKSRLGSVQPIGSSARRSATGVKESTQKPESLGKEKPTYRLTPTFYSKAERVVTEQFPPTMKSQSIENFLKKNQVKPEEIQWLDLETLLKGKQKVTKEELQEWIQANKIEVEDVILGESFTVDEEKSLSSNEFITMFESFDPAYPDAEPENALDDGETLEFVKDGTYHDFKYIKAENKEYAVYKDEWEENKFTIQRIETDGFLGNKSLGAIVERSVNDEDAVKQIIGSLSSDATKHSMYQLPGEKEDYRELLLTLPMYDNKFILQIKETGEHYDKVFFDTYEEAETRLKLHRENLDDPKLDDIEIKTTRQPSKSDRFTTGHYDEPNILAHVRFNTRKSPTGEQVLFIEELQSDWHTKGREKGYKDKNYQKNLKKIEKLNKEFSDLKTERNRLKEIKSGDGFNVTAKIKKIDDRLFNISREVHSFRTPDVPDAPFKGNGWIELIMKRMLRYASENNFDRIAWTTSNQQIERWRSELRQNVDQISWQKNIPQIQSFEEFYKDDQEFMGELDREISRVNYDQYVKEESEAIQRMVPSVIVNGLKKNKSVFNQSLPIEGETTINGQKVTLEGLLGKQMATQIRNSEDRTGVIQGENLTVGGQGFKTVYDFAIKKILNKMGKKFGAKVDQVEILETSKPTWSDGKELTPEEKIGLSMPGVYNEEVKQTYSVITQPSIPVTRKMKESALKGQPTFRASKMTSTDDVLSSPSFKKWFKGSQVKDKDGKPLVVYHGTDKAFDAFSGTQGNWFADNPKFSSEFASDMGGNIHPVYLSLKNPLDFNKVFTDARQRLTKKEFEEGLRSIVGKDDNMLSIALSDAITYSNEFEGEESQYDEWTVAYEFTDLFTDENGVMSNWAKDLGYDGIVVPEDFNMSEIVQTYAVFEPTQIKSIFNKGTFNPHDPRISFRMAPTNLVTPLAKIYQEQKGTKKSYTKENFELDLVRLGYPEETIKTAMDLFGIIRIKQIATDEPTPIEKELQKLQDMHITRSNLKDRIKRAYRLGAVEKEKEITKLQKIVTNYARKNLPTGLFKKSEVTGLLAKVRDAKRARELATALERIDRVIDKVNKRSALAKWNKSIKKKAKVKKVRGVTEGTVGADVQEIVYTIRGKKKGTGYMDLSPVQVEEKIEALGKTMGESEDGEPTEEQAIELNLLLTFGAIKHKTPEEINRATEVFDDLVAEGRMQVVEDQEAYKARMKEIGDEILDVITGGAGPQTQEGAQRLGLKKEGLIAEIKETLSTFDSQNQSLEYIFDKLSRLDKTSKPLESAINNYFMPMIRQARLAEYNGLVEMNTMLRENAERIFKVKDGALTTRLNQNTVDKITIFHLDGYSPETGRASGNETYSELTYNQAYKKWMELQDPTLHKTFEKMGWDVNKTKRQIEDQLPKDMIKWAEWQLYEFYPMYYHRVNKTFRQRFKVNMAFNPVYSPISRRIGARADEGDDTLNKSKSPMGSMTSAGSLKSRVSKQEELTWIDGDTTIMKHITEMEHFIHYTQVMREMRSVFMNRNISKAIQDFHGSGISRTLNKFMDDIARGGVDRSQNLEWMDKLRANFSRSVIGVNPVVYLKQLASIPAYIADIPTLDWSKEFIKVLNPLEFKRAYRTLSKSKMVQMRYDQGFERDMVLALQNQKPGKLISGTDWVNTFAYAFTKMGDKQAIFLGGWAVYKYHKKKALKEGKSLKDAKAIAMKKFEEASLRSQQASDVEDLADFQRRGSAYKLFTMFMTSPNQYYRMIIGGYRNFRAGRGSKSENLRRIFVGMFLLPTLFQFISNGFKWDNEDQATSILLFPFAGLLFFGQGFEYAIRSIFNKAYPMGPVSILDPFVDIGKGLKKTFDGKEFDNKKVFKILDDYISGLSKFFGIPYSGPKRSIENTIKVFKEGSDYPIRESIGFRMKEEKKKKKKKKVKIAEPSYVY
jgi:hypothetical protein